MRHVRGCLAIAVVLWSLPAHAVDVGEVRGDPLQLDVTETSIAAQHFEARTPPGDTIAPPTTFENSGWGGWLNRLNTALRWGRWTLGLRLDSAVYALRPVDNGGLIEGGRKQQPGSSIYNQPIGATEMRAELARA